MTYDAKEYANFSHLPLCKLLHLQNLSKVAGVPEGAVPPPWVVQIGCKTVGSEFKIRSLDRPLYITLHHTATKGQTLKQIANGHIERGFPEIAYFAAINWEGEMFQINEIDEISWHDSGQNTNSIGIVFVGNANTNMVNMCNCKHDLLSCSFNLMLYLIIKQSIIT